MQNKRQEMYENIVKEYEFKDEKLKNILKSFLYGGAICLIGQIFLFILEKCGFSAKEAALLMSLALVFIASLLTGLGIYDTIGKEAHCGTIVPITGFANSMTSSAIDYRGEGYVLGVGTNIFKLAGLVIAAAILSGFVVGMISWMIGGF